MLLSPAIVINERFLSLMLNNTTVAGIHFTYTHVFKMLFYKKCILQELMTAFRGSGHY